MNGRRGLCWVLASCFLLPGVAMSQDLASSGDAVTLTPLTYNEFRARLASNPAKSKYTMVDLWASNCAPCKENFPHLVAMHKRFKDRGLAVMSVSLDDRDDKKAVEAAKSFLVEQKATFANILIDEELGVGFEKFEISAIPAVIIYGADGKELKRFTLDDPNNQFTYDEVEAYVAKLLENKPAANP
jgi:thiol-disulfide isomerase/thioredoxin